MTQRNAARSGEFRQDQEALAAFDKTIVAIEAQRKHSSILKRHHISRRPVTEEEKNLPLHTAKMNCIKMTAACKRMQPKFAARFDTCLQFLRDPARHTKLAEHAQHILMRFA